MASAPAANRDLKITRAPRVYLVGRQAVDEAAVARFLGDQNLQWSTDTAVGAERLAEMAGRVCYLSYGKGRKTNREFLGHIVEVGHGSVLEHGVWSFLITGVSRSFTHELIRHRHFSYSQLSQRYVDESDSEFIEPDEATRNLVVEMVEKLSNVRPISLGQASRIPGVTPAAIAILRMHLRRGSRGTMNAER